MNDTQLYFSIGVPTITVLIGFIVSLAQVAGVREMITGVKETLRAEMQTMHKDIQLEFHSEIQGLRLEMENHNNAVINEIRDLKLMLKVHELEHHQQG